MASEVRDFTKPNPNPPEEPTPQTQILRATPRGVEVQRLSALTGVQQDGGGLEIVVHEEVITEDQKLRGQKPKPGDTEIRVRHSDTKAWSDVKRDLDD